MTANSQLSISEPKKNKNKLSKQLEQQWNHRNGDHVEGEGMGRMGEKAQEMRSMICRYKIDGGG